MDTKGCAYIASSTDSTDFPTANAYSESLNGHWDVYVSKFAADGQSLIYSTYLGGSNEDSATRIAVDTEGCAYITGRTYSTDFPTINAYDAIDNGDKDGFVTKFSVDGQSLLYSTYLGRSSADVGSAIAVDTEGCAYITGETDSTDFPTINAYDESLSGIKDVFVTKIAANGYSLTYSTYLGGSYQDYAEGIAVDTEGCAYITGYTLSSDFPIINAYDGSFNVVVDGFMSKFAIDGQSLLYSTFLGGSYVDCGCDIAVDTKGCAYITGYTLSSDFPIINAYDESYNGNRDAFVTIFATDGQSLLYSTYIGGSGLEEGNGIAVNSEGSTFIIGKLVSTDFPTVDAFEPIYNGGYWDVFVTKIDIDTDLDGIPDYWEFLMGLNATNPTDAALDNDIDGLPNLWEFKMGLNATNPTDAALDNDSDGLNNLIEYQLGTDGRNPDTDSDFMVDGWEYTMSLNATDSNDAGMDKDLDGLPNLWEFQMDLNASDPADAALDKDDDGMPNLWEFQIGLNATNPIDATFDNDDDG